MFDSHLNNLFSRDVNLWFFDALLASILSTMFPPVLLDDVGMA